MAYTITTTAGVTLATIMDGTVNTSATSLSLMGKNYAGYGAFLNENFVGLLENFSKSTAPSAPLTGQLWYDSATSLLKVYNAGTWKSLSTTLVSTTAPSGGQVAGDLWWDTVGAQLKVWDGAKWVVIGPTYTATTGLTGAIPETILDTVSASHVIIKFYVAGVCAAIVSKDALFVPQTSIAGYANIKPGINISTTIANAQLTGTASNALSLNGLLGTQFLRNDQHTSTTYALTVGTGASNGLKVGTSLSATVNGSVSTLASLESNHDLHIDVNKGGTPTTAIGIAGTTGAVTLSSSLAVTTSAAIGTTLVVTGQTTLSTARVSTSLLPSSNNTATIGQTGTAFNAVHATNFIGSSLTLSSPLPVASGGTGSAVATGSGSNVLAIAPALTGAATIDAIPIGFRIIPQNPQAGGYTINASDSGKHIYYTGGASSLVIPTNTAEPFAKGTAVTIVNNGTGAYTLAPSGGVTLIKAGTAGAYTGSLAQYGLITLMKVDTNTWIVSGVGLS